MTSLETMVAAHYTSGSLTDRIRTALTALDVDLAKAAPEDLKPVDEFHTGGAAATNHLLDQLQISATTRVLDIGGGLGGAARLIASRFGCPVVSVDLTPEFVETSKDLNALVGLGGGIDCLVGSALDLPVSDGAHDLALMLHVGMNIEDKPRAFAEARRALAPGGRFAVFDVMRGRDQPGALTFPVPWAQEAAFSFVEPPSVYRAAAEAAGFRLVAETDCSAEANAFFETAFAAVAEHGPAPLGIHLMMGETAGLKIRNYAACIRAGLVAPTEMIFEAPS